MTKIAVITGTSSGLGEALASTLLNLNWKVYGISRRGSIRLSKNSDYIDIKADLTNTEEINNLVKKISELKIDLLVNNAGKLIMEDSTNWTRETYKKIFDINYIAPIELLNALREKLDMGQVITIISESSHIAWDGFGIYGASKAAIWHHMKAFAEGNKNINVINIHPDAFDSPMIDESSQEMIEEREEFMNTQEILSILKDIATQKMNFKSGASIFVHNEWEAEALELLHANEFIYNVDTKILTSVKK